MLLALVCALPVYEGELLGVSARVTLKADEALVRLSGVPVGGVLEGAAVFSENDEVVMDKNMQRALRRRLCAVHAVSRSPDMQSVDVALSLPVFGKRVLRLRRVRDGGDAVDPVLN